MPGGALECPATVIHAKSGGDSESSLTAKYATLKEDESADSHEGGLVMGKLNFNFNQQPTLGIELELGLVDGQSMALTSSIEQVLAVLSDGAADAIYKPELMQCCIEINTGICETIDDARLDLQRKLVRLEEGIDPLGLRLWWGATHPFSLWSEQKVTPNERYLNLVSLLQEMARRLVTFGLHVHVGVDSGDKAVIICDRMMQHLTTSLALSCSSPYWENRNTGLQSHR